MVPIVKNQTLGVARSLALERRLGFFPVFRHISRLLIIIELASGAQGERGCSLSLGNGWEINSGVNFSQ